VTAPTYRRAAWQKVRRYVLDRDGYICQIGRPGCKITANTVDHIRGLEQGGAEYDPRNLQAACGYCNVGKGNEDRGTPGTYQPSTIW
jgi:5-methylcytosine-specific restriction endonuclease McrA